MSARMLDISTACRTCMKNKEDGLVDLFQPLKLEDGAETSLELAQALVECTATQVTKDDGLPQKLCEDCMKLLYTCYTFRSQAQNAETEFKQIILLQTEVKEEKLELKPETEFNIDLYDTFEAYENVFDTDFPKEESLDKPFQCNKCDKQFTTEKRFLKHLSLHGNALSCNICNKPFQRQINLEKHMKKHSHVQKGHKCTICNKNFESQQLLLDHNTATHPEYLQVKTELELIQFRCEKCCTTFSNKHSLAMHKKKHKMRKAGQICLICDHCKKAFHTKSLLKRHLKIHSDVKPFECPQCPKKYTRQDQLDQHMKKHSGLKPNICPYCNKGFAQLCSLKDHIRIHTRETPFLCAQCGKSFSNGSNLRQHMMRHQGLKPFACSLCPKTFSTKGQMTSHAATHTGAHPFSCESCGARFTKPNSLKKHQLIHLDLRPFDCDECPMTNSMQEMDENCHVTSSVYEHENIINSSFEPFENSGEDTDYITGTDESDDQMALTLKKRMTSPKKSTTTDTSDNEDGMVDPLQNNETSDNSPHNSAYNPDTDDETDEVGLYTFQTKENKPFTDNPLRKIIDVGVSSTTNDNQNIDYPLEFEKDQGGESDKEGPTNKDKGSVFMATCTSVSTKRIYDKKHACMYCKLLVSKLPRHLEAKHKNEIEVGQFLAQPLNSKERKLMIEKIRQTGNYIHNTETITSGSGLLIPKRRPNENKKDFNNYISCGYCRGLFTRKYFYSHKRLCALRTKGENADAKSAKMPLPVAEQYASLGLQRDVLSVMRNDDLYHIIRMDQLILRFGSELYAKLGNQTHLRVYVSQRMRQLARLLKEMREINEEIWSLSDILQPKHYNDFIIAVKQLGAYNEETGKYGIPSMPLKLRTSVIQCAAIHRSDMIIKGLKKSRGELDDYVSLIELSFKDHVSSQALTSSHQTNKPTRIPLVSDISTLSKYLKEKPNVHMSQLKQQITNEENGEELQQTKIDKNEKKNKEKAKSKKVQKAQIPRLRRNWTAEEKDAMNRQMAIFWLRKKVPNKSNCDDCLEKEPDLNRRSWRDVKNYVYNIIKKNKNK